ncbi:hypothetical protein FPOAC2_00291 [Fusarium poae]|uniref:hypothetical protein n=1 Tax=Fusarium poae TaxID=36050 RepID=UPI001CE9795B|nr:hypothetical protein FPOAC1_000246 [Fusarium poae]KAG8674281.1 hypothetical protein FPOAC1_000246 [Fusarium poae]
MTSNDSVPPLFFNGLLPEFVGPDDASTDEEFEEEGAEVSNVENEENGDDGNDDVEDDNDGDDDDNDTDEDEDYHHHGLRTAITRTCGLCRFYFEPSDTIVHYESQTRLSHKIFHKECIEPLTIGLVDGFEVATCEPWFLEPPTSMVAHRERWIRQSIAQELQATLMGRRLPPEIREAIASYCTRERATQIIRNLPAEHTDSPQLCRRLLFDCEDPVSRVLWVHYVEIEGFRYVRSLSYSRLFPDDTPLLPDGYEVNSSFNIYFAEDYRGIRQIIATQSDQAPTIHREAGLHWVICCRHQRTPFYLRWENDGVKLRGLDVTKTKDNRPDWERRRWAAFPRHLDTFPQPPKFSGGYDVKLNYYNAIQAVDWNSPGVCGYYFYIHQGQIRGIVTLKLQDTRTTHIDEYDQHGHPGIYVPIGPDERVSELWIRTGELVSDFRDRQEFQVPILRTSKGRDHVLGPGIRNAWPTHSRAGLKEFTYTAIMTFPEEGQTRMFYSRDERDGYAVAWMAFEEPSLLDVWLGLEQTTTERRQITVSLPAPDSYNLPCLYVNMLTSAPLDGVKNVRTCQAWESQWGDARWVNEVVGLLLTYTDGSQRCVGQVRPDSLENPLDVRSDRIWLRTIERPPTTQGDSNGLFPTTNLRVKCVYVEKPVYKEGYKILEVPLTGCLKWHFTEEGLSSVAHFDRDEAYDEMGVALAHGTVSQP